MLVFVYVFWLYRKKDYSNNKKNVYYLKYVGYSCLVLLILTYFFVLLYSYYYQNISFESLLSYVNVVILVFTGVVACLEMIDNYYGFKEMFYSSATFTDIVKYIWTFLDLN